MNGDFSPKSIDEYIAAFPDEIGKKIRQMKEIISKAAPEAEEKISYRMPAFTLKGMLVYFAAHTKHIGFYPFTTALKAFRNELVPYHTTKGGIQFPYKDPLPADLIRRITEFRVEENLAKADAKMLNKRNTGK
jgi:uncharacterized protein YdhG (YjbR/CyaY superfamily)